jgi:predicted RNA methylase
MRPTVRLRQRLARGAPPREELVARHVRGRSFADVGCMWSVDGAVAFAAEAAGASAVTGVDVMEQSTAYRAEHVRRGSQIRFVRGDLHDSRDRRSGRTARGRVVLRGALPRAAHAAEARAPA